MKNLHSSVRVGFLSVGALFLASCQTTQQERLFSEVPPPPNEFRGAWVYDPRCFEPDDVVKNLKNAGFNAVFVRLSSAGAAYYPSGFLPKAPGSSRDFAKEYVEAGKKYKMQIHAWHVCFMMHYASPDNVKSAIKNGEVMRNEKGLALRPTYNVPVRTPALASNRLWERRAMVELVTKYPLDGVQFDYIRYFSPTVDYSATSRVAFEKVIGTKIKKWPYEVTKGSLKQRYHQWRAGLITSVVQECSQAIRTANPRAKISAAVWHSPEVAFEDYAQDWIHWTREGYLDFVVPMNYTLDDGRLVSWLKNQRKLMKGQIPFYAGLGSYLLNRPEQLNRQIKLCRQYGLPGYVLYNYDERLKDNFLSKVPN